MKIAILTTDSRDYYKTYQDLEPAFGTAPEALLQGLMKLPGVEVHVICCTHQPLPSPARIAENIWYHSIVVPKWGWMRSLYAGCVMRVRRKLREIQPDIVHGQGTEKECAISAVLSGFPNVVTLHGIMSEQAKLIKARPGSFYWLAGKLETFVLRRTSGVFCNSEYTEKAVGRRAKKTWRVPNAVREAFFQELRNVASPTKTILLNIGLISPRKRQNELQEALSGLDAGTPPVELHFLGGATRENAYGKHFFDLLEKSGSNSRYIGFKATEPLIEYFDGASALVHVPTEESFGLVVAEALARNLKFFGFRVGGVNDIANGVDGAELFDDGDWAGLKTAISRWMRAGHARPISAAKTMRERYHPTVVAKRHLEIYRAVLNTFA